MKNQKGFTLVEGLLILVIVGILGFTGWYVYSSNNKTLDTYTDANAANSSIIKYSKKTSANDQTANWLTYTSKVGQFTLKYPKSWVLAPNQNCDGTNNDNFLLFGSDAKSAGKYCADGAGSLGQMQVDSEKGDLRADSELKNGYQNITKQNVTLNGVQGMKETGTAKGQVNGEGIGGFDDGTKLTTYIFFTNGRTYTATYINGYSYPDALSDFELMVTKTLAFNG